MSIVNAKYSPRGLWRHMHFSTIYAAKLRRIGGVIQSRERLTLDDGDFLDIDWSYSGGQPDKSRPVSILLHGLEGNAQRPYMLGMAKLLNQNGIDVAAINFRGCSGEQNKKYRSYHSGETRDLHQVVQHIIKSGNCGNIILYGISLGGNVILKYLGEHADVPQAIKAAVAVGAPVDLYASLQMLNKGENWIYRLTFLRRLRAKYREKMPRFPEHMNRNDLRKIKSLKGFDDLYTAPAHGFKDALDYYEKASSHRFLPNIKIPTLLINAQNDSFLKGDCYPYAFAKANPYLHLEVPEYGGHVGFWQKGGAYYNEIRALEFFIEKLH